jgi:hypothetical protein
VTAGQAAARLSLALLVALPACSRSRPSPSPSSERPAAARPAATASRPVQPSPAAADPEKEPLLPQQALGPELRKLVDDAHAQPAVASLEAAGCDLALVMTGADYNRFVDLRRGTKMRAQVDDAHRQVVVYCQRRTPPPPACAELAPIFARVARPKRPFKVFSGTGDPPFAPHCAGVHDAKGKFLSGEGPGYASAR